MEQQQIERDVRRQMGSTFDLLPEADRQSLIATRNRELSSEQHQPSAQAPVMREREARTPTSTQPRKLPPATMPERVLREQLKQAIAAYRENIQQVAESRVVVERANERLGHAQSELSKYGELDARVAAWEIQTVRTGDRADDRVPQALARELRERSIARDRCDRALAAYETLLREQHAAESKLVDAKRRVDIAAQNIAVAQARLIARALADVEQEAAVMRRDICSLQLPGVTLPRDLLDAAFRPLPQINGDPKATQRWREFVDQLRRDPEARFAPDAEPTT